MEEFAVGVAAEEEVEAGEVGSKSGEVVGGVADEAVQRSVELVVVACEPVVDELEEFGELDGIVEGEVDAGHECWALSVSGVRMLGGRGGSGAG